MNIYDFILDEFQYELKDISRKKTAGEPFENTLAAYRDLFLEKFKALNPKAIPKHLGKRLVENAGVRSWFANYCNIIKDDLPNIERLFSDIFEIYELFLSGDHHTAVSMFRHKLKLYDLLNDLTPEHLGSMFRIRQIKTGDNFNINSYYYHIPYNRRSLVGNQRFSFDGIPLHYAGMSMMTSFFELGTTNLDDKSFGVSMFAWDHLAHLMIRDDNEKVLQRKQIYDISNLLYEITNDFFYDALEQGKEIDDVIIQPISNQTFIREFRKLILSSLCTFPRRESSAFVEEYILPQLLTEAIRMLKYDGIIYPSTRFRDQKITITSDWKSNFFKNNIALFTSYSANSLYDKTLYKNYVPIHFDLKQVKTYDAHTAIQKIARAVYYQHSFLKDHVPPSELVDGFASILRDFRKRIRLYPHILVNDRQYLDTFAGKAEVMYLQAYINNVALQLEQIFPKEYNALLKQKKGS